MGPPSNHSQQPYVREGETPPEILAELRTESEHRSLPSLKARRGSVTYIESRTAPVFKPLRDVFIANVVDSFCSDHMAQVAKDSHLLLWGNCVGHRTSDSVHSMEAFPFDIDGNARFAEIYDRLKAIGITFLIYTTYSHGARVSTIPRADFDAFARLQGFPSGISILALEAYLTEVGKQQLSNIALTHHDKTALTLEHDPLEKFRVIVFTKTPIPLKGKDGIGVDGYKELYDRVALMLFGDNALSIIDKSCRSPSQPTYLPATPTHPLTPPILKVSDGELFDWAVVWPSVAEDLQKARIKAESKRRCYVELSDDEVLNNICLCLDQIPPEDYQTWITVIFGVFNVTEGSDEGLAILHDWSSRSQKYEERHLDAKWNSLGSPRAGSGIGLGSLVFLARQHNAGFRLPNPEFDLSLLGN